MDTRRYSWIEWVLQYRDYGAGNVYVIEPTARQGGKEEENDDTHWLVLLYSQVCVCGVRVRVHTDYTTNMDFVNRIKLKEKDVIVKK